MTEAGWADLFPDETLPLDVFLRYRVTIEQAVSFVGMVSNPTAMRGEYALQEGAPAAREVHDRIDSISRGTTALTRDNAADRVEALPLDVLGALAFLCWPRLELLGSHVRLTDFSANNFSSWVLELGGDEAGAEEITNHVHLWDWFEGDDSTEGLFEFFGRFLADTWPRKAAADYPSRGFGASFAIGAYGPEVSLYSVPTDGSS